MLVKVNHTILYEGNEVVIGSLSGRVNTTFSKVASVSNPVKITRLTCGSWFYCHIYFNFGNTGQNTYDVNFENSGSSASKTTTAYNSNALDIYAKASDNNSTYYINDVTFYWIYGKRFNNNHNESNGKPLSVENIWNPGKITIFWINNDNFYAGAEVTAVTTWNIAPGNFVGYIQIWKYKIPYYL